MKEYRYYFSLVTGQVVRILKDEIKHLEKYQIPLIKEPKSGCSKCFDRKYLHQELDSQIYYPCQCVRKVIDTENYNPDDTKFYLPR